MTLFDDVPRTLVRPKFDGETAFGYDNSWLALASRIVMSDFSPQSAWQRVRDKLEPDSGERAL
jgi:hypothetical protein